MLTERSLINFLIWIGGIILGPYLAYSLVRQDALPILALAGVALLFFMFAIAKDMLCIAPLVGVCIAGTLRFIPGKPTGYEFAAAATILYYIITYTAIRRRPVLTGPLYLFIPIFLLTAIIFGHDPHISLGLSGGGREGGRAVVDILLGALAYLCAVSMDSPSPRWFAKTPIFCIAALVLSGLPNVMSTYIPKTAEFFYIFTDNVNIDAYVVDIMGGTSDVVRNNGLSSIASAVVIYLLSYYPLHTWWRPDRWWIAVLVAICTWFVIIGGFRSGFVSFLFSVGLAIWCHSSWRTLILIPPILVVFIGAVFVQNSHLVELPEAAQRTLSFLPGDWDQEVVDSTKGSNEFRERIRTVYLQEEAAKHPLLGNGITYDAANFQRYTYLAQTADDSDGYYSTKNFIAAKMFHTGWISIYDATGLVGCALLAFLSGSLVWVSGKMVFSKTADRGSSLFALKIWLFVNIASGVFAFLTVFGAVTTFIPNLSICAAVWAHLNRLEKFGYHPPVKDRMVPFDPERVKLSVPA